MAQHLHRRSGSRLPRAFGFLSCGLEKHLCSISVALNVFPDRSPQNTKSNRLLVLGAQQAPGGVGRAQQRESCLHWSPGPHVFHSSLRAVSSLLSFSPYNVTECSVNTVTADKTINSVHKDYSAFQQSTENRSVSQSWAFGPSQECFPPDKKGKERRQFYFLKQRRAGC